MQRCGPEERCPGGSSNLIIGLPDTNVGNAQRLIKTYVGLVLAFAVVSGVVMSVRLGWSFDSSSAGLTALLAFGVLSLVTGVFESSVDSGVAGSVVFVAHLAAVVIVGPLGAAMIAGVSAAVAQLSLRRAAIKTVFNVAQISLSTLLGGTVYLLAGGHLRPAQILDQDLIAYGVSVLTYFGINSSLVSGAVAISQKKPYLGVWRNQLLRAAGYDLVASALGLLVAWMYLRFHVYSIFAVALPILALRQAYRENMELKRANAELEQKHREMLELFVKEIELGDPYTSGHSQRVAKYAAVIAGEFNLTKKEIQEVSTAALLHDVGKGHHEFGALLRKDGRLTLDEKKLLQTHPVRSAELVNTIAVFRGEIERAVRHHHENYDGSGYPDGLAGDRIPVGARIIMIADTIDAMTTDRPYRRALPFEKVVEQLEKYAGTQFDPGLAHIAIRSTTIRRMVGDASSVNLELATLWSPTERRGRRAVVS